MKTKTKKNSNERSLLSMVGERITSVGISPRTRDIRIEFGKVGRYVTTIRVTKKYIETIWSLSEAVSVEAAGGKDE